MLLQNWKDLARAHWKEHLPNRYAALQKAGKLEASLDQAANQTYLETSQLEDAGMNPQEAWEMTREKYLLLPEEGTEPTETPETAPLSHRMRDAVRDGKRSMPA